MLAWLRRIFAPAGRRTPYWAYGPCSILGCTDWATLVLRMPNGAERTVCERCAEELTARYNWTLV